MDFFMQALMKVISFCNEQTLEDHVSAVPHYLSNLTSNIVDTSFPPDYPSGSSYDTFIATLPGLGLLDNGKENRSDSNAVAATWIVIDTLQVTAIGLQGVCDSAPSGDIVEGNVLACPPAALAWEAVQATQIVLDQVNFQDDEINGAEIEATFENSKTIIDNTANIYERLEEHDADVKALLAEIKAGIDRNHKAILEAIRLLNTPPGRRETDQPACEGKGCNFPDKNK